MLPSNLKCSICTYVSLNCTKNLCLSLMKRSMCNLSFHQKSCPIIPPTKILYRSHSTLGFLVPLDQHPYGVSQHHNFFSCLFVPIYLHHRRASQHHQHLVLEYSNRPSTLNNTSYCESLASIHPNPSNPTSSINRLQPSDILGLTKSKCRNLRNHRKRTCSIDCYRSIALLRTQSIDLS